MAAPVQGKDVVLLAYNQDGYYPFACAQELTLTVDTEQLPATSVNSGTYRRKKPGLSDWKVSLSGLTYLRDQNAVKYFVLDTLLQQIRLEGLQVQFVFTDGDGYSRTLSGHVTISSTQVGKTTGQLSKYSLEFEGDGAFDMDLPTPPSTSFDVKRYDYTATGAEMFFSDPVLIGRRIIGFFRESTPIVGVITSGTPGVKQVLYKSSSGRFEFPLGNLPAAGEPMFVQYV